MTAWHPQATRVPYSDAGAFTVGKPKLVWHTTETKTLPSYGTGSAPHFTFDPRTGKLWQHIAIGRAAKSLVHPPTVETNRAHATQVEMIAYSDEHIAGQVGGLAVVDFTDADYHRIAELARWIEDNAGVHRACGVPFVRYPSAHYPRMAPQQWLDYNGHCGHQHVPGNLHGDPSLLKIGLVLGGEMPNPTPPPRNLKRRMRGDDVVALKKRLRKKGYFFPRTKLGREGKDFGLNAEAAVEHFQRHHKLHVDGVVGPKTRKALGL